MRGPRGADRGQIAEPFTYTGRSQPGNGWSGVTIVRQQINSLASRS